MTRNTMKRLYGALLALALSALAPATQLFAFTFDPAKTYTDGYARILIYSRGSFHGTFAPVSNPLGTQTKAGTGSFGLTENDSIVAAPFMELGHAALVRTSGTFSLDVDRANLKATLTNYRADRVPTSGLKLSTTIALNNEMFQTKRPNGTFRASLPPLKLGLVTIDSFKVTQQAGARTSTILPLGSGNFAVAITFMADIQLNVSEFGQTFPIRFEAPYSLVGLLHIEGSTATFGYGPGRGGENISRPVQIALQPFPFFVQTEGGLPASLVMNAAIHKIGVEINGTRQMFASTR